MGLSLVSMLALFAISSVACGANTTHWVDARHVPFTGHQTCGEAFNPDHTKALIVCRDSGLYTCFDISGEFRVERPNFDGDCRSVRAAIRKEEAGFGLGF
jgi:hypothetical protein